MTIPLILNTVGIAPPEHGVTVIGGGHLPPVPPDMCDAGESRRRAALVVSEANERWGYRSWAAMTVAHQYRVSHCERQPWGECLRTDDPAYECREVALAEVMADPDAVWAKAARLGPLTLLDANGEPRLRLSVLEDDDEDD